MTAFVNTKQIYKGNAQPLAIPLGAAGVLTTIKVVVRGLTRLESLVPWCRRLAGGTRAMV